MGELVAGATALTFTPAFKAAYAFVRRVEGGYARDGHDSGGSTMCGITQRTYDAWRSARRLPTQDVRLVTEAECERIYFLDYWIAAGCDKLPVAVALVHFDAAVNHGVGRAKLMLQTVRSDPPLEAAKKYISIRRRFYLGICLRRPTQLKFLRGWMRRLRLLKKQVRSWAV